MKSFLAILLLILLSHNASAVVLPPTTPITATEPEKIISITQVLYEKDYYELQVDLWNDKLSEEQTNADAWMNYYLACRVVNMLTRDQSPHNLERIYNDLQHHIKDTYEYHYLTYLNGQRDIELFHHLEKAFALDPVRTEVLSHMVCYYAIKGNTDQMAFYNKLWLESGEISSGILNWNYNSLIGLDDDAILLTYGDNDTYPSWMLQQIHNVRTDVHVINIHLLRDREYTDQVFAECSIPYYPKSTNEQMVWEQDLIPVLEHLFHHSGRPVYINVTLPKKVRDNYRDVLYNVGLAFKYSTAAFDNLAVLQNNYENKFLTDYLRLGFSFDKSESVLNSMNVNYLPAFISLYNHYIKSDEQAKAESIRQVIENIGSAAGREEEIAKVLDRPIIKNRKIESQIDIKALDKKMKQVMPNLWVEDTETTNEFYNQFLLDLLKEKEFDLLDLCKSEKVDWLKLIPKEFQHLPEDKLFSGGHPDWNFIPVTNISYSAAETYCEWLTLAYNSYSKKKRHKKVKFRLPTEEEWEFAAYGNSNGEYPWGGSYHTNIKGCYLSNFYSSEEEPCKDCEVFSHDNDGGFLLVHADAYFPNNFGLYGCSGNAAEMIQGGKIAKGGSWEDKPIDCKIKSKKDVVGPSPAIGFRVFMEVIE